MVKITMYIKDGGRPAPVVAENVILLLHKSGKDFLVSMDRAEQRKRKLGDVMSVYLRSESEWEDVLRSTPISRTVQKYCDSTDIQKISEGDVVPVAVKTNGGGYRNATPSYIKRVVSNRDKINMNENGFAAKIVKRWNELSDSGMTDEEKAAFLAEYFKKTSKSKPGTFIRYMSASNGSLAHLYFKTKSVKIREVMFDKKYRNGFGMLNRYGEEIGSVSSPGQE